MSRTLSELINSGQKGHRRREENTEMDVSELFAEQIDRRMERKIQKSAGGESQATNLGYSKFDQAPRLLSGNLAAKPKLSDKDQEEIERQKALEDEKRIRKRYELESEKIRLENLERLRQENLLKKREMERAQEQERKKQEKSTKSTAQTAQKGQRTSTYNPLGPIEPAPDAADSLYKPVDPAQDNRFVFSLKLPDDSQSKAQLPKPRQAPNYNPLQVAVDQQGSRSNLPQKREQPVPVRQQVFSKPQAPLKPAQSARAIQPAAPRAPGPREAHPQQRRPQEQGLAPEQKIAQDLARLRSSIPPRPQVIPLKSEPEAPNPAPKEKKQKRVNPKNDPNCSFCFKCQEYHHKDLHMQQAQHIINLQRGSKPPTNIKTISSQSSRPTGEQIAEQKAVLDRVLGKRQPQHAQYREEEEEEEEDDFDYGDDFIDDDDDGQDYKKQLRKLTGYDPSAYDDDDFDDRHMEVRNFDLLEREDRRSKLIGSYEDRMEQMRELAKKKKKALRR